MPLAVLHVPPRPQRLDRLPIVQARYVIHHPGEPAGPPTEPRRVPARRELRVGGAEGGGRAEAAAVGEEDEGDAEEEEGEGEEEGVLALLEEGVEGDRH